MFSPVQLARNAVKNFGAKQKTVDKKTGNVNADKLVKFLVKPSRHCKRGYVKNDHQLSTKSFSLHAGIRNYLETREAKKGQLDTVGQLTDEQMDFVNVVKSVARAGRNLNDVQLNTSIDFILRGKWESEDAYRITPELGAHVMKIADALNKAKLDAASNSKAPPAVPNIYVG